MNIRHNVFELRLNVAELGFRVSFRVICFGLVYRVTIFRLRV